MQTKINSIEATSQAVPKAHPKYVAPLTIPLDREQPTLAAKQGVEPSEFVEKAAHYRTLLAKQAYETKLRAPSVQIAAQAYFDEATKVHRVGNVDVGIYAPFVLAQSALRTIYKRQIGVVMILGLIIGLALLWNSALTLTVMMGSITAFYFANLILTLYLSVRVFDKTGEIQIPDEVVHHLAEAVWPRYTILCPLYKEAAVVRQFADAMQKLDYPVDKLQIMFLTESDDEGTRDAIRAANLPSHFEIITVPDGQPRTKPRACNYGLLYATGEFVVIYDAEDVPDSLQLKKAVLSFIDKGLDIGCVQAKLNFYNSRQNILTRWFTVEYSTWFDTTLPGLQWAHFALPLGGTSNHFRLSTLRGIGAWDAYNVTEDCDLGLRLASQGYHTLVLDSTTYEEANPNVKNWIRQRSRWIKGYMQTYLIYMRQPFTYLNPVKLREFISMQLIVGGRTAVLLINPIMWIMVVVYFTLRSILAVVDVYQTLFPGPVLYFAVMCLIFGNLTYIYTHFIGCLKRNEFSLVKWTLLMPVYWALASYAAFKGLYQLITKPHYWEKTIHGLHLPKAATNNLPVAAPPTMTSGAISHEWALQDNTQTPRNSDQLKIHSNGYAVQVGSNAALLTHQLRAEPVVQEEVMSWMLRDELITLSNGSEIITNNYSPIHKNTFTIPLVDDALVNTAGTLGKLRFPIFFTNRTSNPLMLNRQYQLRRDPWLWMTVILSMIMGVVATITFFSHGELLIYIDAVAHIGLARALFDNATPGAAQLGGVWLPLPHLLMMPFTAIDRLWFTGLAGAAVSSPCYVLTCLFIFLAIKRLTGSSIAGFAGSLVAIANPNFLYLQSTPLTEPLAAATATATGYFFLCWVQEEKFSSLLLAAFCAMLASMSRYDGWAIVMGLCVLVPFISLLRRRTWAYIEANSIFFIMLSVLGIALWIIWCAVIFGNPFYFQTGEYSSFAIQSGLMSQNLVPTAHNLIESIRTIAVLGGYTLGPILAILGVIGLVVFAIWKRQFITIIGAAIFVIPFTFYTYSLYAGQVIIYMPELAGAGGVNQYWNNRFGLITVAPAAIYCGLLVAAAIKLFQWFSKNHNPLVHKLTTFSVVGIFSLTVVLQSYWTIQNGIISLEDGQHGFSCLPTQNVADYLLKHYSGGRVLVSSFYRYVYGTMAHIDMANFIYEGTEPLWHEALKDPASVVEWIVIDPAGQFDKVSRSIDVTSPEFTSRFTLAARELNSERRLYRRIDWKAATKRADTWNLVYATQECPSSG